MLYAKNDFQRALNSSDLIKLLQEIYYFRLESLDLQGHRGGAAVSATGRQYIIV